MTTQEALDKVKSVCFSHLQELQKEADAMKEIFPLVSEETAKALEWEIHELSEAIYLIMESVSSSINDGK
jgi:hypothetical protein